MRISEVHLRTFKRFSNTTIQGLSENARLVVLIGQNGCGKSSVLEALRTYHGQMATNFGNWDVSYHVKSQEPVSDNQTASVRFHGGEPQSDLAKRKAFYFRSSYRHEADFTTQQLGRLPDPTTQSRLRRLIDADAVVSENYRRLVMRTLDGVYDPANDGISIATLRHRLLGELQTSMANVFPDLAVESIGEPLVEGTFLFTKGNSRRFRYKNLSAGEKAAFDLLLDIVIKRPDFDDTVFCIDEPELHMHTRMQAALLAELLRLLPEKCQLWIATHSVGMIRSARDIHGRAPSTVAFLDFHDRDYDKEQTIEPTRPSRSLWRRALNVALDDMADLVGPKQIVLCEGQPHGAKRRGEFDAECLRVIFEVEFAETAFLSAGNASDVESDRLGLVYAVRALVKGTEVIRVIDRDDLSPVQVEERKKEGIRVLGHRHLEAYLYDDEVLTALCTTAGKPEKTNDVLAAKKKALEDSTTRGNAPDDMKSAAGTTFNEILKILALTGAGNNQDAFARDTLAPLLKEGTAVYKALRRDIFGI